MSYYIVLSENSYGEITDSSIPDSSIPNFRSFNVKIQKIFKSLRKAHKEKYRFNYSKLSS